MADLTDSDFYIYSEISDLNAVRTGPTINLAPLLKNPSVSRGEIVAPQPGEDLYAHNFINLNDWSIAAAFMNPTNRGSSSSRTDISSNSFTPTTLSISEAKSLFSNHRFSWYGPEWVETAIFNPLIDKSKMPTSFSSDNGQFNDGASFIDGIRSLVRTDSSIVFVAPNVFQPTTNQNNPLAAYDFSTPFASFRTCAQNLCSGYRLLTWFKPSVQEWNTSHSGGSGPWTPTGIGPYAKAYRHVYSDQSVVTATQTSRPVYNDLDVTLLNCAYVKSSSGQTTVLKNARDFLDFTFYVVLYQSVTKVEYGYFQVAYRLSFSKAQSAIGSIITPQGTSEAIFRLDPAALANKIYSMSLLDPSQYATPDEHGDYDVYVDSDVQIATLISLKNPPTP